MANCSCSGSTGSTYSTLNRSLGCLSSVPTSSGIPYNCFLPATNTAYYQNFPIYNGPCGTVSGGSSSNCNNCGCNSCNSCDSCDSDSCNSCNSNCGCNNNCCCNTSRTMFCNCPCNLCCGPAAALVTSSGAVSTVPGGQVPVYTLALASDNTLPLALASLVGPITVTGDTITFNCTGTYLVTLTIHLPDTVTYDGTIGLVLNGTPVASSTQSIDVTTEAYSGSSQALVRVTEGSTMTVNTSAALTATPDAGNIVTISIVRVA